MSLDDPWVPPFEHLIGAGTQDAPLTTRIERRITNIWPDNTPSNDVYFSHNDHEGRPEHGILPQDPDYFEKFDALLAQEAGYTGPGYVGTFIRGYSGFTWPATFQETTVASAPSMGIGAMINVKTPTVQEWKNVVSGLWDDHIRTFFNSWPVGTPGTFTLNHEPENDIRNELPADNPYKPYHNGNPVYTEWAREWGPIWCMSIARVIHIAAPIIRSRGLDVKIGGCLMEYSWNEYTKGRWQSWRWWDYVDPNDMDVAEFQMDMYAKAIATDPITYQDLVSVFAEAFKPAQNAGIRYWSIYEMAAAKMEHHGGGNILEDPNDTQRAAWWNDFATRIVQIPGGRFVSYFVVPNMPLREAWIEGDSLAAFANICLNNKRL